MQRENALLGGEESGGYGFRGHVPERDGLLAGLYILDLMARTGKTLPPLLESLRSKVGHYYYDRHDIHFNAESRQNIIQRLTETSPVNLGDVAVLRKELTDGFRFVLADDSWLLIRFSGTEPLLRIYAESHSSHQVQNLLDIGRQLVAVENNS